MNVNDPASTFDYHKGVIPISSPTFGGNEERYVLECLRSGWISSKGEFVDRFESAFAALCGARHAVSCCNGTVALHAAMLGLGIGAGDEVIVPTLTFIASANTVVHCGATPVFVDSEPEGWNLDPRAVEAAITPRTRAIMAVHLYGQPADMAALRRIATRHRLLLIEDAAEAHGATIDGRRVGTFGDVAAFSFYGNKIVTCGEGGMVVTDDAALADRVRMLKGQGQDFQQRWRFPVIGYNYRMTNVQAAIGLAQLERFAWHLERREQVLRWYRERLRGVAAVRAQSAFPGSAPVPWLFSVVLEPGVAMARDPLMQRLAADGIETRPVFPPVHAQPCYEARAHGAFPVAENLGQRGLSLPTWSGLTEGDVTRVCQSLTRHLGARS